MSWHRDSDGKIVTDEEYRNDCMECECFCQEGMVNIPCNGERTDCPHFKEVDTSDYDKEIRDRAIEEFASLLSNKDNIVRYDIDEILSESGNFDYACDCFRKYIDEIAEQMKEVRE